MSCTRTTNRWMPWYMGGISPDNITLWPTCNRLISNNVGVILIVLGPVVYEVQFYMRLRRRVMCQVHKSWCHGIGVISPDNITS